jgi:hypothetical protein
MKMPALSITRQESSWIEPSSRGQDSGRQTARGRKKGVQNVKTVWTFPPESLFTKDAKTIAKAMGTKKSAPSDSDPASA